MLNKYPFSKDSITINVPPYVVGVYFIGVFNWTGYFVPYRIGVSEEIRQRLFQYLSDEKYTRLNYFSYIIYTDIEWAKYWEEVFIYFYQPKFNDIGTIWDIY